MAHTVRDLLDEVRAFHGELSKYYLACSATTSEVRARMFLDFMAEHELALSEAMAEYEVNGSPDLLNTWIKSPPELAWRATEDERTLRPESTVDEVLTVVLRFHERIAVFFEQVATEPVGPRVTELFEQLREYEQLEERRASRVAVEAEREM